MVWLPDKTPHPFLQDGNKGLFPRLSAAFQGRLAWSWMDERPGLQREAPGSTPDLRPPWHLLWLQLPSQVVGFPPSPVLPSQTEEAPLLQCSFLPDGLATPLGTSVEIRYSRRTVLMRHE